MLFSSHALWRFALTISRSYPDKVSLTIMRALKRPRKKEKKKQNEE